MKLILVIILMCFFNSSWSDDGVLPKILYIGDSHSYGKLGTTIEKNLKPISSHLVLESSCGSTPGTWLSKTGREKTVCGFWKKDGETEIRTTEHANPKLSDELANYHPDITIVQLGTNIAANEHPLNSSANIEQVLQEIELTNSRCIWIGPPDANSKVVTKEKLKITNDLLINLTTIHGCQYVDSLKLTTFPLDSKEDIIHLLFQQNGERMFLN